MNRQEFKLALFKVTCKNCGMSKDTTIVIEIESDDYEKILVACGKCEIEEEIDEVVLC